MKRVYPSQQSDARVSVILGRELRQALEEQRRRLAQSGLKASLSSVAAMAVAKGLREQA